MGILSWVVMGLFVGIVAKFIMPGDDPGGFIITMLLGISGAFVGGLVASFLGFSSFSGFNFGSFLIATGGALLILAVHRAVKR